MKIKQPPVTPPPPGRYDGVAIGNYRYGTVGNWWRYPLNSPSPFFTQCNDVVRGLDLAYLDLGPVLWALWEAWVAALIAREICELFKLYLAGRTTFESGKAGFVNCNSWLIAHLQPQVTMPPDPDSLPDGDTISLIDESNIVIQWDRRGAPIKDKCVCSVFYQYRNTRPALPVQIQKMKYVGFTSISAFNPEPLGPLLSGQMAVWPGKFLQVACCIGQENSCPFFQAQVGEYLPP